MRVSINHQYINHNRQYDYYSSHTLIRLITIEDNSEV